MAVAGAEDGVEEVGVGEELSTAVGMLATHHIISIPGQEVVATIVFIIRVRTDTTGTQRTIVVDTSIQQC